MYLLLNHGPFTVPVISGRYRSGPFIIPVILGLYRSVVRTGNRPVAYCFYTGHFIRTGIWLEQYRSYTGPLWKERSCTGICTGQIPVLFIKGTVQAPVLERYNTGRLPILGNGLGTVILRGLPSRSVTGPYRSVPFRYRSIVPEYKYRRWLVDFPESRQRVEELSMNFEQTLPFRRR